MKVIKRFHTYLDGKRVDFGPDTDPDQLPPGMVKEYGLIEKGYVSGDDEPKPKKVKPRK